MALNTSPPHSDQTRTIWILDDDAELCSLLCERFRGCGWAGQPFYEPSAMLSEIRNQQPDLLLIDQMLPEKKGSDVIQSIREDGYQLPILMLSALGAPKERVTGLESGADDYLAKPFLFRELQLRIEKLMQQRSSSTTQPTPSLAGADHISPILPDGSWRMGVSILDAKNLSLAGPLGSVPLSRGDVALLGLLCRFPQQILSRSQLASASGSLIDLSHSRSIDVRMSRLRRAFKCASGEEMAIESVRGQGYRLTLEVQEVPAEAPHTPTQTETS